MHDNRYGREMVGSSAGFEPALPAISNLNLNLTMTICANSCAQNDHSKFFLIQSCWRV